MGCISGGYIFFLCRGRLKKMVIRRFGEEVVLSGFYFVYEIGDYFVC